MQFNTRKIILATMLTFALVACGGKETLSVQNVEQQAFDDIRAEIRAVIGAPDREANAISLVDQLQQEYVVFRSLVEDRRFESRALNANYDTTREQFENFLSANREQLRAARERTSGAHRELMAVMTRDEWEAVKKINSDAMNSLVQSLRSL